MVKTQIQIDIETRNELRKVQGKYGCLTFNEVILTLIEHDSGIPFQLIKEMAQQGKTIADLLALSKRWAND